MCSWLSALLNDNPSKNNISFLNKNFEISLPARALDCNTTMRKLNDKYVRTKREKMQLAREWFEQKSCPTYFAVQTREY
jgi:hypothetical protein